MAANITFITLLFLVACGAVCGGAEWHSSIASGRLYAMWSGLMLGILNITQLDPSTGASTFSLFKRSASLLQSPCLIYRSCRCLWRDTVLVIPDDADAHCLARCQCAWQVAHS
jgi:hypothetical protein